MPKYSGASGCQKYISMLSHVDPNSRVRLIFACDRNKSPLDVSVDRVLRTSRRRTGCKFSDLAKQSLDGSTWALSYRPDQECARHNHHPPSEDPSAHPAHRRLDNSDASIIPTSQRLVPLHKIYELTCISIRIYLPLSEVYTIGSPQQGEISIKARVACKLWLTNCIMRVSGA
jgi:hypothetical protein